MDLRRLSDEASRNATNPYPVYSAIEKHCYSNGPIEGAHATIQFRQSICITVLYVKTAVTLREMVWGEPSWGWIHRDGSLCPDVPPGKQVWKRRAAGEEARDGHGQTTRFVCWCVCLLCVCMCAGHKQRSEMMYVFMICLKKEIQIHFSTFTSRSLFLNGGFWLNSSNKVCCELKV